MFRSRVPSSRAFLLAGVAVLLALAAAPAAVRAVTAEDAGFLALYFSPDELEVFSATRSLKSVATIAENVTVVTAEDIELANAHTVAEAVYNVTGIEMADFKGPGSGGTPSIQASGSTRVTVLLDGVPLGTANNDFSLARLPAGIVRKIEIVKGPASSVWGSSFGGVVNVITKSAEPGGAAGGAVAASYGGENTTSVHAEARAGAGAVGVYVFGGALRSDGVQDGHEFAHRDVFAKTSFDAGAGARLDLALYHHDSDSVNMDFRAFGVDVYEGFDLETFHGKADLRTALAPGVDVRLSAWTLRQDDNFYAKRLADDAWVRDAPVTHDRRGVRGDLAWRAGRHLLAAGADFADVRFEHRFEPRLAIDREDYGLFVNDTVTAGGLCVTAGVRYDHSSLAGGLGSPALGLTYLASRDLLFRGQVARGFHAPASVKYFDAPPMRYVGNKGLDPEIVWSYQGGLEANVADLVRAKASVFYHDVDDVIVEKLLAADPEGNPAFTAENGGRARVFGGELELLTNRLAGFTLEAGASWERIELRGEFTDPLSRPERDLYGVNGGVSYDAGGPVRAVVKAHYFRWDVIERFEPDDDGVVVDANLRRRLLRRGRIAVGGFVTGHNLLDAASYADFTHRNPGRWVEAGVDCRF